MKNRFLSILVLSLLGTACTRQVYKFRDHADDSLFLAMRRSPGSKDVKDARMYFEKGEEYLAQDDYENAERSYKRALLLIRESSKQPEVPAPEAPQPEVEATEAVEEQAKPKVVHTKPSPLNSFQKYKSKKVASAAQKAAAEEGSNDTSVVRGTTKPEMRMPPKPEAVEITNSEPLDAQTLESEASAAAVEKAKPKTTAATSGSFTISQAEGRAKTKIPGTIKFTFNDSILNDDAMGVLDQTASFLIDNPSSTLILRSQVAAGEGSGISDGRFEAVRAYLVQRGVPEDQIRLDFEQRSGDKPLFEFFKIEH